MSSKTVLTVSTKITMGQTVNRAMACMLNFYGVSFGIITSECT